MADLAVFTGDIVKSTKLTSAELSRIFDGLQDVAATLALWQGAPTRLTRFRGDGWQMTIAPRLTLRALLAVRAAVRRAGKGFDTRIGVGLGDGSVPGDDLAGAEGEAFVRSGHALDQMRRSTRMSAPDADISLRIALPLADQIVAGWTPKQAEIALLLLPPSGPTQADVASALGLTQQTVQQQVETSGLVGLIEACELAEDT